VSGYGYERPTTPGIDALMGEGTVFLRAYTPTPTTAPSHATLLTGRYPLGHGVLKNGYDLEAGQHTLAETLVSVGYVTGAVVSAYPLAGRFGWTQGFSHFDDTFPERNASIQLERWEGLSIRGAFDRRAKATTDRAIAWLDSVSDGPIFLWVHYYDPHAPYDPPPKYRVALGRSSGRSRLAEHIGAYDAEIRFADDQVTRLVSHVDGTLGADQTLLVVATDHGEGFEQHGHMGHGANLYEELVRVMLFFRWPGVIPAGDRVDVPVGLVDVVPTVSALLGVPSTPTALDGMRLGLPFTAEGGSERVLYFQRRHYDRRPGVDVPPVGSMRAVRRGRWKLIVSPDEKGRELFDVDADPGELRNVVDEYPDVAAALAAEVENAGPLPETQRSLDGDVARRLRALGYVD
jgi:arylsulfatase A-like enzyme